MYIQEKHEHVRALHNTYTSKLIFGMQDADNQTG